jgi:hypothetical protein
MSTADAAKMTPAGRNIAKHGKRYETLAAEKDGAEIRSRGDCEKCRALRAIDLSRGIIFAGLRSANTTDKHGAVVSAFRDRLLTR